VAFDALQRTEDVSDRGAIVEAIQGTSLDTIVGNIDWSSGPVPNVSKTPLVGGQWQAGEMYPFELKITVNSAAPDIETNGETQEKTWA
jgi:branched-chain amino acid transport system substrate-binding protein